MVEEISESSMDHMMAGIEEILGHHGGFYLRVRILTNFKIFKHFYKAIMIIKNFNKNK